MLNLSHSLIILSSLFHLVLTVALHVKVSSDVANLVVANRWASSTMAIHSMLNTEQFSVHTMRGKV